MLKFGYRELDKQGMSIEDALQGVSRLFLDTAPVIYYMERHPTYRSGWWKQCSSILAVSLWEIQIKTQIGKLTLRSPLAEIIAHQQTENEISLLPITLLHIKCRK
jgi:PIN domain nuclease of toxin-antitoxin system